MWNFARSAEKLFSRWAIKRFCKFWLKKKLGKLSLPQIVHAQVNHEGQELMVLFVFVFIFVVLYVKELDVINIQAKRKTLLCSALSVDQRHQCFEITLRAVCLRLCVCVCVC